MIRDWQHVFFDFDGVLVTSAMVKVEAFVKAAELLAGKDFAQKLDHAIDHELLGAERVVIADWVFKKTGGKVAQEDFLRTFVKILHESEGKIQFTEGCEDFLDLLGKKKIPFSIISAAPRGDILEHLKRLGMDSGLFREISGSEQGKKTEILKQTLQDEGLEPGLCVYFGDMPSDAKAAGACGVPFIRIRSPLGERCAWPEGDWEVYANFREILT